MTATMNLNDTVWVRMTDAGRTELARQRKELRAGIEDREWAEKTIPLTVDEQDGWSEWLLWDLMHTFGGKLFNGQPNPPIEMEIAVENPLSPAPGL